VPYAGGSVATNRALTVVGAETAIASWAIHDGCAAAPRVDRVAAHVTSRVWSGCADGTGVAFYRIDGGGHTWPGSFDVRGFSHALGPVNDEIDAADVMLAFLRRPPDALIGAPITVGPPAI